MHRFDGSFVYLLTARLEGDTLRGTFHAASAGRRPSPPCGAPEADLRPPTEVTKADSAPFVFAFPDLDGRVLRSDDPRFRGKVLVVDIFGTWCPTCHEAAPVLTELSAPAGARPRDGWPRLRSERGPGIDGALVRRYRDKFGIPSPCCSRARTTSRRRRPPNRSSRLHRLSHHALHRPRRAGAEGARRLLRPGDGRAARGAGCRSSRAPWMRCWPSPPLTTGRLAGARRPA